MSTFTYTALAVRRPRPRGIRSGAFSIACATPSGPVSVKDNVASFTQNKALSALRFVVV